MNPRARGRRALRVAVASCVALAVAGCADRGPETDRSSEGQPLALDDERVERVLAAYAGRADVRRALQGTARVALEGPDFALNRPQRIAVSRPSRIRFEILGLFDQLAAILVADGRDYAFYDGSTGEIHRGPVSRALLWRLAKIDLSPRELVGFLLAAPRPAEGTLRAGAWLEPSGRLAIAFARPGEGLAKRCAEADPLAVVGPSDCVAPRRALSERGGQVFFFDEAGELAEVRGFEGGAETRYGVRFERYAPVEGESGVRFPERTVFSSPGQAARARFDWKRVRLVPEVADETFQLREPRSA